MVVNVRRLAAVVALISAPLAGCANAYDGQGPDDGLRAQLPAHAAPGECYARVRVPGETAAPPPVEQGAHWVQNPGPPGSPGPIWCLEPTGPVAGPPPVPVERYGWIRVLCDQDVTPERIGHIQHRLHERGYYRGEYSGRYDRATADGVARFQEHAHIRDGGYLGYQTMQALDGEDQAYDQGPPPPPQREPQPYGYQQPAYPPAAAYPAPGAYPLPGGYPGYALPQAAPCGCDAGFAPPPAYYPQSYGPCCATVQPYGRGTPTPPYAWGSDRVIRNGWLMWDGKSGYDGR